MHSSIPLGPIEAHRHSALLLLAPRSLFLTVVALGCFALPRMAPAVTPAPDGGYPGGNTAEGSGALLRLTTGLNNTAIGAIALELTTTGSGNTATGADALIGNGNGNENTATGSGALQVSNADDNTATGFTALNQNTTGIFNTATGVAALFNNTTGSNNTATGLDALVSNTNAGGNTATGFEALFSNTTGPINTATGAYALYSNTTGQSNVATGVDALYHNQIGHDNTADGYLALLNSKGSNNTALGSNAGASLTTGNNNIDIGANVLGNAGEANTIRVGKQGTQKSTFVAGIYPTAVTGSTVVISSAGKLGIATSSARFKNQIKPMENASEAVLALKPVTFRYKEEVDPDQAPQFGLVAEEVEKVSPDLVIHDEEGKPFTVRYEAVNAMLLNEFLKEHETALEDHRKVEEQQAMIAQMKKQIDALTAGLQKVSDQMELAKAASQTIATNQ